MSVEFLDCEELELAAVRAAVGEEDYIRWFDTSDIKQRIKKAMMKGQRLRCCYCQRFNNTINNGRWDLEHILCERFYPQFFTVSGNLAIACDACNNAKSQEDILLPQPRPDPRIETLPDEPARYSIPHPYLDDWAAHMQHVNYQIYRSDTDKGVELLRVCKLNKQAIEVAGLDHDTLVAAVRRNYFDTIGNPIDVPLLDAEVVARMASVVDAQAELQIKALLDGLETVLTRLSRAAGRRTPEKATETAVALAAKRITAASPATLGVSMKTAAGADLAKSRARPPRAASATTVPPLGLPRPQVRTGQILALPPPQADDLAAAQSEAEPDEG
ncbi:HNH endonuclease [Pseudomonas viridiflava]|uniref:HNH endonuclease n=1 Tax=Pseudomonas viridiflava TaxID=33069 RepID=A0A3M5PE33_PSEVI|nr:hypothetical protein [Pseudomonas viridiflava]RMT82848.1 hypothetical protein ALP40_01422 [Pseudomonas viridiflava]